MADRVTYPGVYIEELPQGTPVITGVPTSITAFVGRTPKGPTAPLQCASFSAFQQNFGDLADDYPLTSAIQDFFGNGGTDAIVVRVSAASGGTLGADDLIGREDQHTGIYGLDGVELFNLLCIPPDRDDFSDAELARVYQEAAAYCLKRRAMLIIDPPRQWSVAAQAGKFDQIKLAVLGIGRAEAANCAVYFPRVRKTDAAAPDGPGKAFAASGAIAGVFAMSDTHTGVWKAPAGITAAIAGIVGLERDLTEDQIGILNSLGINCLRNLSVYGPVVWGARTLRSTAPDDDYKYIPVRRLALYIEESLLRGTQFAVFEPNDPTLWATLNSTISNFMSVLWQQGALVGSSISQSYFVRCDSTTTTPADIANGVVNIVVGFAAVRPAEFMLLQIQQMAGQTKP